MNTRFLSFVLLFLLANFRNGFSKKYDSNNDVEKKGLVLNFFKSKMKDSFEDKDKAKLTTIEKTVPQMPSKGNFDKTNSSTIEKKQMITASDELSKNLTALILSKINATRNSKILSHMGDALGVGKDIKSNVSKLTAARPKKEVFSNLEPISIKFISPMIKTDRRGQGERKTLKLLNERTKTEPREKWTKKNILPPKLIFQFDAENIGFPSAKTKKRFLEKNQFIPKNIFLSRIQFAGDRAFVAIPKLKPGVPFSLGKISLGIRSNRTILAFPNWSAHHHGNLSAIQNAVDIFMDERNTLWILDSGIINTLESPQRVAPPKVFAIDLKKDEIIKVIDVSNFVEKGSKLQQIVVEIGDYGCQFVYISDAWNRGLVIWDVCNDFGSRIVLPKSMVNSEIEATGRTRNTLYLTLLSKQKNNILCLTYYTFSSIIAIPTHALRNLKFGAMTGESSELGNKYRKIVILGGAGKILYFRFAGTANLMAWNVNTAFGPENFQEILTGNSTAFATHVTPGYKKYVWALESNFQDYEHSGPESNLTFVVRSVCRSFDLL